MNKCGELSDQVIGVIIAAAGVAMIIFWLITFYNPGYDEISETSESYFDMLQDAVKIADDGGIGGFYLLDIAKSEGDKVGYYLIYFGKKAIFDYGGKKFARESSGINAICVCSWEDEGRCVNCVNLDFPAVYTSESGGKIGEWAVGDGARLNIRKEGGQYVFEGF